MHPAQSGAGRALRVALSRCHVTFGRITAPFLFFPGIATGTPGFPKAPFSPPGFLLTPPHTPLPLPMERVITISLLIKTAQPLRQGGSGRRRQHPCACASSPNPSNPNLQTPKTRNPQTPSPPNPKPEPPSPRRGGGGWRRARAPRGPPAAPAGWRPPPAWRAMKYERARVCACCVFVVGGGEQRGEGENER